MDIKISVCFLILTGCPPPPAVDMCLAYGYCDSVDDTGLPMIADSASETDSGGLSDTGDTAYTPLVTDSGTTDTGPYVDPLTVDNDGDGYCEQVIVCADGSLPGDCDDNLASAYPGGVEICDPDNVDEDCDAQPDDWDSNVTAKLLWIQDLDGDTFGNPDIDSRQCDKPSYNFVLADTNGDGDEYNDPRDCNDAEPSAYPGAPLGECVDGVPIDYDCDGSSLDCL